MGHMVHTKCMSVSIGYKCVQMHTYMYNVGMFAVIAYEVKTVTSKEFGGGTDANVYITLHGEQGDSGKRFLRRVSEEDNEGKDKFEKVKVSKTEIELLLTDENCYSWTGAFAKFA